MTTNLPWPTTGGVYLRQADGSLVRADSPASAAAAPAPAPATIESPAAQAAEAAGTDFAVDDARGQRVRHID